MLQIKKNKVEALPKFKRGIYWAPDNTLYKIIKAYDAKPRDNFYIYVNGLRNINGLLLPIDLLKDDSIYGYQLPFIHDSKNIDEIVNRNDNIELDVIEIMKSIFAALQEINKHLVLGDVRNTNILIKDNHALFIDWENGKRLNSSKSLLVCYCIVVNKHIVPDSKIGDTLKALLSALSIYYDMDMEGFFANRDLNELLEILQYIKTNPTLLYYVEYLIDKAKCQDDTIDLQFSDLVSYIMPPSTKEKGRLTQALKHNLNSKR